MNKKIIITILLIAALAITPALAEEPEATIIEIGEAITLIIISIAVIQLFLLSKFLEKELKTGIILLASALLVYGPLRELLEIIAEFLIEKAEICASITELAGGILFIISCLYLRKTINKLRKKT